jgi:hypothetical protein
VDSKIASLVVIDTDGIDRWKSNYHNKPEEREKWTKKGKWNTG